MLSLVCTVRSTPPAIIPPLQRRTSRSVPAKAVKISSARVPRTMDGQAPSSPCPRKSGARSGPGQELQRHNALYVRQVQPLLQRMEPLGQTSNQRTGRPRILGSTAPDKLCRFCRQKRDTTSHVVSPCPAHLREMTGRHDRVQTILTDLLWNLGIEAVPKERFEDGRSIPDVAVTEGESRIYIDITVPLDDSANLYRAAADKKEKYGHLEIILPLVVGALGSREPLYAL